MIRFRPGGSARRKEVTFRRDAPHAFTMIWHFYGDSRLYGSFIALCEIVPAVLLLVPRTATVGAAGIFVVMLNVTVMDWTFGLPVPTTLLAWRIDRAMTWQPIKTHDSGGELFTRSPGPECKIARSLGTDGNGN